jgi:hypothetical protein
MGYSKLLSFFLLTTLFLITSCEKINDDKLPPVIILNGNNPATVLLGCNYNDPGVRAKDDSSVPVITVSGDVNPDSTGVYYLNYTATDDDGNQSFLSRKVIVRAFDFDLFEGQFNVYDTITKALGIETMNYQVEVSVFNQTPKMFVINNFGNLGENLGVVFQPDSTGNFLIDFSRNDTIIEGTGQTYCTDGGFRINYYVQADSIDPFQHRATFKK